MGIAQLHECLMPVRTRFAPSPTGYLHLGHVLAAKVAHDLARSCPQGVFLLRHEDIDHSRVRPEYEHAMEEDLRWLGLPWHGPALKQSQRTDAYHAALKQLREKSLIYPCFCTRREIQAELAAMPAAPHDDNNDPPYPGTCRKLSAQERERRMNSGIAHCWRLDSSAASEICGDLSFIDLLHGTQVVDPSSVGDVVLSRKEIGTAYHLAVVVDDAFQQITHVSRGEDLLNSTPIHRVLQHLLDLPTPTYLHHPLVLDASGRRLAKRHDSLSIRTLREQGKSPADILSMLEPWLSPPIITMDPPGR